MLSLRDVMGCRCSGHYRTNISSETANSVRMKKEDFSSGQGDKVVTKTVDKFSNTIYQKDSYLYDINISCHERQIDWVETHLLSLFEDKLKLRCFLFERDRPSGVSYPDTIEASLKHSRKTIVCFSRDFLSSSWKQFEALMAHHVDPLGMNGAMIPIVLDDCELPVKYSGFTALRWPSPDILPQSRRKMRLKFFWTNLLRSLDIQSSYFENGLADF